MRPSGAASGTTGNVVPRTTNRTANGVTTYWVDRTSYDMRGNRLFEYYTDTIKNGVFEAGGGVRKKLTYDAANHLTASLSYFASSSYWVHETGTGPGQASTTSTTTRTTTAVGFPLRKPTPTTATVASRSSRR
jgi:hypothetical protein